MTIEVIDLDALAWQEVSPTWPGKVDGGEPDVRHKPFELSARMLPGGQLVEYEAGHVEAPHNHVESEVFYVLDGELGIGDVRLTPGMLAHISGGTVYGPSVAGPRGARFLRLHLEG